MPFNFIADDRQSFSIQHQAPVKTKWIYIEHQSRLSSLSLPESIGDWNVSHFARMIYLCIRLRGIRSPPSSSQWNISWSCFCFWEISHLDRVCGHSISTSNSRTAFARVILWIKHYSTGKQGSHATILQQKYQFRVISGHRRSHSWNEVSAICFCFRKIIQI